MFQVEEDNFAKVNWNEVEENDFAKVNWNEIKEVEEDNFAKVNWDEIKEVEEEPRPQWVRPAEGFCHDFLFGGVLYLRDYYNVIWSIRDGNADKVIGLFDEEKQAIDHTVDIVVDE